MGHKKNKNKKKTEDQEWAGKIESSHSPKDTSLWVVQATRARAYGEVLPVKNKIRPTWGDCAWLPDKEMDSLVRKNFLAWKRMGDQKIIREGAMAEEFIPLVLRFKQPIKLFQIVPSDKVGKMKDDVIEGVTNLTLNCGGVGSQLGFRCYGACIPTFHYMLHGARYWIIIKHTGSSKLEELVAGKKKKQPRAGCVYGEFPILSPATLEKYGIEYETVVQRKEETLLMFPGVHYSYINLHEGTTVVCAHFPTVTWFEHAYILHKCEVDRGCLCEQKYTLDYEKIKDYEEKYRHGIDWGSANMKPPQNEKTEMKNEKPMPSLALNPVIDRIKALQLEQAELQLLIEKNRLEMAESEERAKAIKELAASVLEVLDGKKSDKKEKEQKYQKEFERIPQDQCFKRRKLDIEEVEDEDRPSIDEMFLEMSLRDISESESDNEYEFKSCKPFPECQYSFMQ